MTDTILIYLSFLVPVAGIISLVLLPYSIRAKTHFIFVFSIAVLTSIPAIEAITGTPVQATLGDNPVLGTISFHIDSLSAWFILIINLTSINGALYGIGYMKPYSQERENLSLYWILYLLFQSSMIWVCMAQDGLVFILVWELMSISSFLLVIFDKKNKTTLQAGIHYLVQMHIGVLFLTAAFIWVYSATGSFQFEAIPVFFSSHSNRWLFLLFFAGFGIKAGFIPLHSWLPQAHPAAPSPVSAVMSGVIVKLGIYGIFRIVFLLKQDYIVLGEIILVVSVLTGLYGILNASVHRDFKKMLAYCTIENIGIIGLGIGLGLLGKGTGNTILMVSGFAGALLHTFNHSLLKSLLFFTAGSVYQQTHTRDMEKLGGLIHRMPQSALLFLLGSIAIGGLPPFNGFVSEFIIYSGILLGIKSTAVPFITLLIFSLGGLALMGGISMLTFTKSFGTIFLGSPRTQLHNQPEEVSRGMLLPQYLILVIMLSIGIFPEFYFSIVNSIITAFIPVTSGKAIMIQGRLLSSIATTGKVALLFIFLALLIYFIRQSITRKRLVTNGATWGCGYIVPSVKMQYTGKSFSKSLGKLLNFIVLEKKRYNEILPAEIFPAERKYRSHYNDFFVTRVFKNIIDRLLYSLNYFQFIQNGNIRLYILYGLFFIVLVFLGTIFKII